MKRRRAGEGTAAGTAAGASAGRRHDRRKCGVSQCLLLPVTAALLLTAGCASSDPPPPSEAVQAVEASRAAAAEEQARQEAGSEQDRRRRDRRRSDGSEPVREKIVVVSPGGVAATAPTAAELAEATRAERARMGDRSVGELTDENLAELASRGKVTFAGDEAGDEAGAGGEAATDGSAAGGGGQDPVAGAAGTEASEAEAPCGETCWRRRAYDLRLAWSESVDEIARLEAEAADLRWRFYAEEDPWVRDSQIKPAWDRALDRLRLTRNEAERYAERVDELMEQGRRAGALPGWLREGVELEPERTEAEQRRRDDLEPAEPVEPTVVEQDARQPTDDPR